MLFDFAIEMDYPKGALKGTHEIHFSFIFIYVLALSEP